MDREAVVAIACALSPEAAPLAEANLPAVTVPASHARDLLAKLRNGAEVPFDMLLTHTAAHWPEAAEFELLYELYSSEAKVYLLVSVRVPENEPVVSSVSTLWKIAEWQEREVYDLFGVRYLDHPDLRRILLDDEWEGHPLRKDYKDDFMLEGP